MGNMTAMASRVIGVSSAPGGVDLAARAARLAEIRSTGAGPARERADRGWRRAVAAPLRRPTSVVSRRRPAPGEQHLGAVRRLYLAVVHVARRGVGVGYLVCVVGLPRLGLVAAAEAGVVLERLALVPAPGPEWASVVAALLDGVDIVVLATPGGISTQIASRLTARIRQRGAVLVSVGRWPGADLVLEATGTTWHGLGQGRGRLRSRETEVVAHGRGAAARARRVQLRFPAPGSLPVPASPSGATVAAGGRHPAGRWFPPRGCLHLGPGGLTCAYVDAVVPRLAGDRGRDHGGR